MKNLTLILLLLLMPLTLAAQSDLAIAKVLDGRYQKNQHTTDVEITSNRLSAYHLDYYHSLTVTDDAAIMDAIAAAVLADEERAIDKEISTIGAQLYYAFMQMSDNEETELYGVHRYIFFRDMRVSPTAPSPTVMLIYMEGPATLEYIKNKFKK